MKRLFKIIAGTALGAVALCAFAPAEARFVGAAVAAAIDIEPSVAADDAGGR